MEITTVFGRRRISMISISSLDHRAPTRSELSLDIYENGSVETLSFGLTSDLDNMIGK